MTTVVFPNGGGGAVHGLNVRGRRTSVWLDGYGHMYGGEYQDTRGRYRPITPRNKEQWAEAEREGRPLFLGERDRQREHERRAGDVQLHGAQRKEQVTGETELLDRIGRTQRAGTGMGEFFGVGYRL